MYTTSALAAMLLIAVAFWGYGRTVWAICAPATPTDAGTAACVGLGAYLTACGFIELTACASPALFIVIIATGVMLAAMHAGRSRGQWLSWRPWSGLRGPGLILPLLFVVYLAFLINVAWWHFVNTDDTQGYLVMPLRLLQTGSTGLDPFLFRRVEAGLGGNSYLYALPLAIFDFPAAHVVDFGLGSVLLALLVGSHLGEVAAGNVRVLAASLALALAIVIFAPVINLAPDVPAIAIFYAAIRQARRLSHEPAIRLGEHVLFGLLLFALVCLRTSYLTPAFAVAASLYLAMLWTHRNLRVAFAALAAFAVVVVFAVPWMVVLQRIAGTPYYPLLGFGTMTHAEVAGFTVLPTLVKNVGRILLCYALVALGLWTVMRGRTAARSEAFLCVFTPLLLLLSLLAQTKYTVFGWRYGYVAVVPLPLFLFVELLAAPAVSWWQRNLLPACLALFAVALVHHESWHPDTVAFGQLYVWAAGQPYNVYAQEDATADRETLRTALRSMQDAVPPHRRLLVRLDMPFLLDFRRNPIWVMDHPGLCGPPPGVPQSATVGAWTRYLTSAGVEYAAYAYANDAGEPPQNEAQFLRVNGPSYFQERIAAATAAIQSVLLKLRAGGPVIYDDGTRSVIAVGDRATGDSAAPQGTGIAPPKASAGS